MSTTVPSDVPPASASAEPDQRQHPRFRVLCVDGGAVRLAVRPEFRGRKALMIDVSTGGIGLVMAEPLAVDTQLVFEVAGALGMPSVGRLARVRSCRPHPLPGCAPWLPRVPVVSRFFRSLFNVETPASPGQAWFIGAEFDRPLSDDEMQLLTQRLQALAERPQ
jgi:hypothetical protein